MESQIEQSLVWRLICHPEEALEVSDLISPDDFITPLYRKTYQTTLRMLREKMIVDLPALYIEMGRPDNISGIIDGVEDSIFPASHYARLIKQKNLEGGILEAAKKREYEDAQTKITELKHLGKTVDIETICQIMAKGDPKREAYFTGYADLDSVISFESTDLFVIAGKSSVGKTILGTQILANMAKQIPVGFISFEMSEIKIVKRLSYSHSMSQLNEINPNFHIACPIPFNLNSVRKTLKEMVTRKGIKVILIDYLQLMQESKEFRSRHLEVSHIIRQLKEIAKEYSVGIMVVSALSRNIDQKGENAKPVLGDLKESGDIEYASDIVCFLHRQAKENDAELIVAKNRNGTLGIIKLVWLKNKITYGPYEWREDSRYGGD